MRKLLLLLTALMMALVLVPVTAQADAVVERLEAYNTEIPPYGLISAEDLGTALIESELILLDVREIEEYEAGHIEGSFNVPIRTLGENLDLLPDLDAEIIVICQGGARAMLAQAALRVLGYENSVTLQGGMGAWVGEDFPTTVDPFMPEAAEAPEINEDIFATVNTYFTEIPEGFGLIRADALNTELIENPDIILIDVRSPEEWDNGYIAGTEFIWINEFMSNRDMWPADMDAEIVVYCGSSYRAGIAAVMMELMGYENVRNLVGGINAWNAAGLPLEGAPEVVEEDTPEFDFVSAANDYLTGLPGNFNAVRVDDVAEALAGDDAPFLLDVRTVDEYTEAHIEGAINIPLQEVTQNLDLLPGLDAEIVIYCGSGHRSAMAMVALNLLGYENATSMLSGFNAWTGAGNPGTDVVTTAEAGEMPDVDPAMFEVVDAYMTAIPAGYYIIRADALNAELVENPDLILVDVRTEGEFADGFIPGAVNVPLDTLLADPAALPPLDASVVFYDNPTHRSTMAMVIAQIAGWEDVRTLGGGFGAWSGADLPVEMP